MDLVEGTQRHVISHYRRKNYHLYSFKEEIALPMKEGKLSFPLPTFPPNSWDWNRFLTLNLTHGSWL